MRLRLLERGDLEAVRALRNANREWFFHDAEIGPDEHEAWFDRLAGEPVRFYVIEVEGRVVGTISVTETPAGREVGNLLLDDAFRGGGLMARALADVTAEPGTYFARVKPDNMASLRVFERAGFAARYVYLERD